MTDLPDRSEQLDDLNTKLEMVTNLANFYNSEVAIIKQTVATKSKEEGEKESIGELRMVKKYGLNRKRAKDQTFTLQYPMNRLKE